MKNKKPGWLHHRIKNYKKTALQKDGGQQWLLVHIHLFEGCKDENIIVTAKFLKGFI